MNGRCNADIASQQGDRYAERCQQRCRAGHFKHDHLETNQQMEVTPDYAAKEYRGKMDAHIADLRSRAQAAGMDYFLLQTDRPLDAALREYLNIRHKRN